MRHLHRGAAVEAITGVAVREIHHSNALIIPRPIGSAAIHNDIVGVPGPSLSVRVKRGQGALGGVGPDFDNVAWIRYVQNPHEALAIRYASDLIHGHRTTATEFGLHG